jgi:hypothetical protein
MAATMTTPLTTQQLDALAYAAQMDGCGIGASGFNPAVIRSLVRRGLLHPFTFTITAAGLALADRIAGQDA